MRLRPEDLWVVELSLGTSLAQLSGVAATFVAMEMRLGADPAQAALAQALRDSSKDLEALMARLDRFAPAGDPEDLEVRS
jgi:p-aminobenzoyl-glutamate transporter AbgT